MNAEIVVYGLATLIDNTDDNQNPSRLIFPHDPSTDPKLRHFCFIEVAANDVRGTPTIDPATRYLRGGVLYWRWILAQHRVSFGNVNGSGQPLARSNRFHTDVPRLTDVTPELKTAPYKPRPECFFELPAAGIFNAFVDFPIGAATVVDFGEVPIEFYGMTSLEVTRPGMVLPLCGRFTIPLNNDHIVLMLDGENQEHEAIYVRAGATFTIGNAREEDITGGSIDPTPSRHFLLYYKMFEETIFDPGIPREVQIPTNACVITTYP